MTKYAGWWLMAYDDKPESQPDDILSLAQERFKQAYESAKDDFESCKIVQDFIAGDQWPPAIKQARESSGRPCLTLDHLNQYVRHVINSGLLREKEVRVLAMSGEADDEVAEVLAGLIRQITQTSTSRVAYETALRHSVSVGFGYILVKVQSIRGAQGLQEIVIKKIKDPRMVLLDPFCDYPDGRDAQYGFIFTKLTHKEFRRQYPEAKECKSWDSLLDDSVLPWVPSGSMIVAEYYYYDGDTLKWVLCCPDKILDEGVHHGNVIPIIRCLGDEYEYQGKQRVRGLINDSSMDAQRAYNYSSSAFIENAALAPLAPWVAADGQIEPFAGEWKDAHRVPRAVLRYKPVTMNGQPLPPPQRAMPAGIPEGWQGMMQNLIQDTQMIMGVSQPNVLGTGGIPVQSGIGIQAQQEPGDVNTFHFIDHWHSAIEQTGRVILAMIPHVYNEEQAVKIVGADGVLETAILNPSLPQPVQKEMGLSKMGLEKVLSTSYNHMIGRYDVAITTGPASASKKAEVNQLMTAMVQAYPDIMNKAGDLVVQSMDMAGADELAKRLRAFLPPGVAEDDEAMIMQQLQQFAQENQQLKAQVAEMEKIILGEREKSQADLIKADMKRQGDVAMAQQDGHVKLVEQQLSFDGEFRIASMKAQIDIEKTTQDNIVKLIIERMRASNKLDVESLKQMAAIGHMESYEDRMGGYANVLDQLNADTPQAETMAPTLPPREPDRQPIIFQVGNQVPKKKTRKAIRLTRPDGSQSVAEVLDLDDEETPSTQQKKTRKAIRIPRPDGSHSVAEMLDLDDESERVA